MSCLYKQKKTYWLAYYYGGKLIRESLHTRDKSTAIYLKNKKENELAEGKAIIPNLNRDIFNVVNEYEKASQFHKTKKTLKDDLKRIRQFLQWANIKKLNEVSEKKLQEYLNHRINSDKITLNTANHIITNIKTWLNFAVRSRYLAHNPLDHQKKYRLTVNPPRFLTKEEIKSFLAAAKPTSLYPILVAAIYTGMRQKELFTLEWPDIDFTKNTITVRNKDGFTTKSKKFRVIPLHSRLKSILGPSRQEKGLCFDTTNHRRLFGKIIEDSKLKDVGWKTLRHTFASQLIMAGAELATVSAFLGHASITTTMIYIHLTKGHKKIAIEKLDF